MGFLNEFIANPLLGLLSFFALIISIGFHEFCHVLVATALGDTTGKAQGRLTLNPLAHLSPVGTIAMLVFGLGWGKPAPFNPEALRYRRFGPTFVALGGPVSNLFLVGVFGLLWKLFHTSLGVGNLLLSFLELAIFYNAALAVFNLLPIPPLDGSHLLRSLLGPKSRLVEILDRVGMQVLVLLLLLSFVTSQSILTAYIGGGIRIVLKLFGLSTS